MKPWETDYVDEWEQTHDDTTGNCRILIIWQDRSRQMSVNVDKYTFIGVLNLQWLFSANLYLSKGDFFARISKEID